MYYNSCLGLGLVFTLLVISPTTNGADPVKLSVYLESLCPDSRNFYIQQMYPVWLDLKDIMEMDINFYGKITETDLGEGRYEFFCQHGPAECQANMMMDCSKKLWTEEKYLEFSNCVMEAFISVEAGPSCALYVGEDYSPIERCWTSAEGEELLHETGVKQKELDPPLSYVPWILINDVYSKDVLEAAQDDLRKVICDAYTGVKPDKCLQ